MTTCVMIVVTHLLGSGHLSRALTLARAFATEGHTSHVVSGGFPAPQLDSEGIVLHQLPPLRSDGTDFSRLLSSDGEVAGEEFLELRCHMLLDLLRETEPDIVITELFPFGRRSLRKEFLALLADARTQSVRPRVFASVRDILAPPTKPGKAAFADEVIADHYDAVLVHSDPAIVKLDDSWPVTGTLARKLRYTGFVAPPLPTTPAREGGSEIIVTAGGGSVGGPLYTAALDAARLSGWNWRILVGGADAGNQVSELASHAPPNVFVERTRPDFRAMLLHASAVVSLCGYNTVMDILQTGCPAVIVPFDEADEVEQGLRARALSHLPQFEVLRMGDLDGRGLLAGIDRAVAGTPRDCTAFRFDGARETVRICMEFQA